LKSNLTPDLHVSRKNKFSMGMGVRVSPTLVSQVTPTGTQALELGVENVLETEMT